MPAWTLAYYNAKVAAQVDAWPDGILASFSRIASMMLEHGPDIGMPHTRAMGAGLFEVRAKGREGIGRASAPHSRRQLRLPGSMRAHGQSYRRRKHAPPLRHPLVSSILRSVSPCRDA